MNPNENSPTGLSTNPTPQQPINSPSFNTTPQSTTPQIIPSYSPQSSVASNGDIIINQNAAPKKDYKRPLIIGAAILAICIVAVIGVLVASNIKNKETATLPISTENFNKFFNYIYAGEEKSTITEAPSEEATDYKIYITLLDYGGTTGNARTEYFAKVNELWLAALNDNADLASSQDDYTLINILGTNNLIDGNEIFSQLASDENAVDELREEITASYQPLLSSSVSTVQNYGQAQVAYLNYQLDEAVILLDTDCFGTIMNHSLSDCSNYEAANARITQLQQTDIFAGNELISSSDELFAYPSTIAERFVEAMREESSSLNGEMSDA